MNPIYTLQRGMAPLLLSLPHAGTHIPPAIADKRQQRDHLTHLDAARSQSPTLPRHRHNRSLSPQQRSLLDSDHVVSQADKRRRLEENCTLKRRAEQLVDAADREARDAHTRLRRCFATEEAPAEADHEKRRRNKKVVELHKYVKSKCKASRQ